MLRFVVVAFTALHKRSTFSSSDLWTTSAGRQPSSLACMNDMLRINIHENLQAVIQIAMKYLNILGPVFTTSLILSIVQTRRRTLQNCSRASKESSTVLSLCSRTAVNALYIITSALGSFAGAYTWLYQGSRIVNAVSGVIDTEIIGSVRFGRLQDILCFKAVWLDCIPVFERAKSTAPSSPVIAPVAASPAQPEGRSLQASWFKWRAFS